MATRQRHPAHRRRRTSASSCASPRRRRARRSPANYKRDSRREQGGRDSAGRSGQEADPRPRPEDRPVRPVPHAGPATAPRPRRSRRARSARWPPPGPRCRPRRGAGASSSSAQASQDRLDPAPGLLPARRCARTGSAGRRSRRAAGARRRRRGSAAKRLVEVEVERHRRQRLAPGAGALGRQQVQLEAVFGLQLDDQLVRRGSAPGKIGVRHRPEVDDDLRVARRQALAGAQVERHAGPAPVLHLGAQRDEGLGAAARAAPWLRRGSPAPPCRRRCRRGTGRAPRRAPTLSA